MRIWISLLLFCGMLIGCSSANLSPSYPPANEPIIDQNANQSRMKIGVSDSFPDGSPYAGMATMGLYSLHLDFNSSSAELVNLRNVKLTDVLEVVDITNFLTMAPCTKCARVKSVGLDSSGNLVVSIGIKHPFDVGDPYKPITGRNRADLHVFNVEGIIASNSSAISFPALGKAIADFSLLDADGYTGYLDSSLDEIFPTNASIHPYKLHFADYSSGNYIPSSDMGFESVTNPPPSGNLVMAMGCDYDYRDYIFPQGTNEFDFIFAVGCSYAVSSASKSERFSPEYRAPQHNKKAASEVHVEILSNDLFGGDTSSTATLRINVVDINHGVAIGTALNEMLADSSVSAIAVEVAGVTSGSVNFSTTPLSGTGHNPSDSLVFEGTITNSSGAMDGLYQGLLKVTDSYSPGLNTSPLLNGMDGIKRVDPLANPLTGTYAITEFATYQTFDIAISSVVNAPPTAVLKPDPAFAYLDHSVDFNATESYDIDGTITLYEFDFDWDGIVANFLADESNVTGLATSFPYSVVGQFTAGLRVTDNLGAQSYDSVEVEVSICQTTISEYDMALPNMNTGRQYPAWTVIGNQVWILGGYYTYTIEVFNLDTETWDTTPRANLPSPVSSAGCAHLNGKIYLSGGYLPPTRLNTTMVYDIASNTWNTTTVPPFIGIPRNVVKSVAYNDEIYVYGGYNPDYTPDKRAELDIYNPSTNSWRAGTPSPTGRTQPFWVVVGDKIYAGSCNSDGTGCDRIHAYTPSTDSWAEVGTVPAARYRFGMAAVNFGDTLYLVGGHLNTDTTYKYVDAFDIDTQTFDTLLDLPESRSFGTALAFSDCRMYIMVGGLTSTSPYRSVRAAQF